MMSSSNADEVIKKRLLDKTDDSANTLGALYIENKDRLNNLLIFPQKPKWTGYENEKQFIDEIRCRNGNMLVSIERKEISDELEL